MRTISILTVLASLFVFTSCVELGEKFEFDFVLKYASLDFTTTAVAEAGEVVLGELSVQAELGNLLKDQDASIDRLLSLTPKRFYLEILDSQTLSFDPIESISVYISAPNQPEFLLASLDPVGDGFQQWVELEITDKPEMQSYLEGGEFSVRLVGVFSEPVAEDINFRASFELSGRAHQ
ncbi:MAG: hypothetical protein AAFN10_25930 [Bacteroidota bacterium]